MAADWQRIELSREQIRAGELEKIRAQFSLFCMAGDLAAVAIFTRRIKSGGSEVFFSPAAQPYAEFIFDHHPPCASRPPALLGTTLLVGHHAAVADLLGRPGNVQSPRKTAKKSPVTDVALPQPVNAKVSGS